MNLAALADQHRPATEPCTPRGLAHLGRGSPPGRRPWPPALADLGVAPDDRVAIVWPTSVDFVVAYLGVLAAGAVAVPLNPNSPAERAGPRARVWSSPRWSSPAARSVRSRSAPTWCCPPAVVAAGARPGSPGSATWDAGVAARARITRRGRSRRARRPPAG